MSSVWLAPVLAVALGAAVLVCWPFREESPPRVSASTPASAPRGAPAFASARVRSSPAEPGGGRENNAGESLSARLDLFWKKAADEQSPVAFEAFLADWIAKLEPGEDPAVLAWLRTAGLEKDFEADVGARIVRHWAQGDPQGASDWAWAMPPGPGRDLALENIAIVRANQGLADASRWAGQLPAGDERNRVAFAVANEAVRTQPVEALRLAADLPASPAGDELIRRAAMEWTAKDQPGALDWARQIPDKDFRAQVFAGVAVAWAERDPAAAGAFAARELPPGRMQDDAVVGIAQRWAQRSPESAAAWIDAFPAGDLQRAAAESVAAIWAARDARQAGQWRAHFSRAEN